MVVLAVMRQVSPERGAFLLEVLPPASQRRLFRAVPGLRHIVRALSTPARHARSLGRPGATSRAILRRSRTLRSSGPPVLPNSPSPPAGLSPHTLAMLPVRRYPGLPSPLPSDAEARGVGAGGDLGAGASVSAPAPASTSSHASCAVCLEEYAAGDPVVTLPCWHGFHSRCVATWLRSCGWCPLCKADVAQGLREAGEVGSA